jgi:diguanylate cyclase (GGDEF)-like protein/PAS domain S-box-containing protein
MKKMPAGKSTLSATKRKSTGSRRSGPAGPEKGSNPLFPDSLLFSNTNQGIIAADARGCITAVNPAFTAMTGFVEKELSGKVPSFLFSDQHDPGFSLSIAAMLEKQGKWQGEALLRKADGTIRPSFLTALSGNDKGGQYSLYLFSDVAPVPGDSGSIDNCAYFDPLTRLPNRRSFGERLSTILRRCRETDSFCALLLVDIDKFHAINDMLSFSNGDQLLQSLSNRLKSCVREMDAAFRLGNDEFALVLESVSHPEDVSMVAKRVLNVCAPPFRLSGREIYVTVSIGIGICPSDGTTEDQLLKSAHSALDRAKEFGVNHFQHYHPSMNAKVMEEFMLDNDLRKALQQDELLLHYQPQVDLASGKIFGAEALIRWMHPQRGVLSPLQFVHLAESNGLIIPIGEWVLKTACIQARKWQEKYSKNFSIAVNLSNQQFQQMDITERVACILKETGLNPGSLELEITETVGMKNPESTLKALQKLKSMGVRIAIDDFGTGYSSIYYLKKFPIDSIKIDRSFVDDMAMDPNAATIVLAMIAMARSLNLSVIAEGVETRDQLDYLFGAGCRKIQGFIFGRPVTAPAFEQLLLTPPAIIGNIPQPALKARHPATIAS